MVPAVAALAILLGFLVLGAFTLLTGYAAGQQLRAEKQVELYDWERDGF